MFDMEITPETQAAIEEVVLDEVRRFGATEVRVIESEDHDGDPALFVMVHYDTADARPDPKVLSTLVFKVNDRLHQLKERRFAYLAHRIPEHEKKVRPR